MDNIMKNMLVYFLVTVFSFGVGPTQEIVVELKNVGEGNLSSFDDTKRLDEYGTKMDFEFSNKNLLKNIKYWGYQLDYIGDESKIKELISSSYDLLVIEPVRTITGYTDVKVADIVKQIKNSKGHDGRYNKLVIAYLNVGEAESWRWYWDKIKSNNKMYSNLIVKPDPDGWSGEYLVEFWDKEWKDIVLNGSYLSKGLSYESSIQQILDDGFDGVYLDWVEAYADEDVKKMALLDGVDPIEEMLGFLSEIRTYTEERDEDFIVIKQNASSLANYNNDVFDYIDGISQEAIWYDGTSFEGWENPDGYDKKNSKELTEYYLKNLEKYKERGISVFNVEYARENAKEVSRKSRELGFIPYCSRRTLSNLEEMILIEER